VGFLRPTPIFQKSNQTHKRHLRRNTHFEPLTMKIGCSVRAERIVRRKMLGILGPHTPHFFQKSIRPPKGTSLHQNTHFEPLLMKIGCSVHAERIVRRKCWEFWAPTPPIFFQKSIRPPKGTSLHQNTHFEPLLMKIGCSVGAERTVRRKCWGFWAPTPPIFFKSQSDA